LACEWQWSKLLKMQAEGVLASHRGFHHEDLVLHRQFGWIHATKAGLTGSHFHMALDASDFFEQSSYGAPPPKSKGA
jgi:hypothetical protein